MQFSIRINMWNFLVFVGLVFIDCCQLVICILVSFSEVAMYLAKTLIYCKQNPDLDMFEQLN